MPPGLLNGEVFRVCPTGRRPREGPRTHCRNYVSGLVWEHLGVPLEEVEEVTGAREVKVSWLRLLPPASRLHISSRRWMDGWMTGECSYCLHIMDNHQLALWWRAPSIYTVSAYSFHLFTQVRLKVSGVLKNVFNSPNKP